MGPLRPTRGPSPPRAEPFATRTPIGLPPSSARGGRILHACRKDTESLAPGIGERVERFLSEVFRQLGYVAKHDSPLP